MMDGSYGKCVLWACAMVLLAGLNARVSADEAEAKPAIVNGGLLRNSDFQDDWLTLIPELKNHHWNYTTEVYNRRDYNPDGWTCSGSWQWENADAPRGKRRMVLAAPAAEVSQSVNWVAVHNSAKLTGWPDAGGYPTEEARRSKTPGALVRDLVFRVKITGTGTPAGAGEISLSLAAEKTTVTATSPLPAGDYKDRVLEVTLKAEQWITKANEDPEAAAKGLLLPTTANCSIRYKAGAGSVVLHESELIDTAGPGKDHANNGAFTRSGNDGYAEGWTTPAKYFYFPPGLYYNFNTWHNSNSENRGPVAIDPLLSFHGKNSLKMIVAAGDEKFIASPAIVLSQNQPQLIEASVWVKTDQLGAIQIDAEDQDGKRLDCYNLIQKYPLSVGSNDWRKVRQVFAPITPVKSIRIRLAARGLNGYTLDDTNQQPQNNMVGTVWWNDLRVFQPELDTVKPTESGAETNEPHLANLDLGEKLLGLNELKAKIVDPKKGNYKLVLELTSPSGVSSRFESDQVKSSPTGGDARVAYTLSEPFANAYSEYHGKLSLVTGDKTVGQTELWFGTWTVPINLELGALYLAPDAPTQFVKANLGLSSATLQNAKSLRLQISHRSTGKVVHSMDVPATPDDIQARRQKIPSDMRNDLRNLILADLDVSKLPVQPFNDPQRNWIVRATLLDRGGGALVSVDSQPFCRQAHDAPQPAVESVRIDDAGLLYVNEKPFIAWGATYGFNPAYAGPADTGATGKYHDLSNLKPWGMYDRHGASLAKRREWDADCVRYVAGSVTPIATLEKAWTSDNIYCSSAFAAPDVVWSLDELAKKAGGKDKLDAYLAFCKTAPMVVSTAPGIEEAFGLFTNATPAQIAGLGEVVQSLRQATGKPVMVGHGGYYSRIEFEKALAFDIFDPETEPLFPANLHTEVQPLIAGKAKVTWLRPQMYEDVPYERWRFHVYVEMMRGCRGWQLAHGIGDASLFRGLHGELAYLTPMLYSKTAPPKVTIEPGIEHMVRKLGNKTLIIAATTHGLAFGTWRTVDTKPAPTPEPMPAPAGRLVRETAARHEWRDDSNGYSVSSPAVNGPCVQGMQYISNPRTWPAGSKVVQWLKLDGKAKAENVAVFVKADGRWTHAAAWGKFDLPALRAPARASWFLRTFYRNASGFMGWGNDMPPAVLALLPEQVVDAGPLPGADAWAKIEVPLEKIGAADKLIDGVAFMHEGGSVQWARTSIVAPDGTEQVIIGDHFDRPAPEQLVATRINVAGLKKGAAVRVLFEDRQIVADEGGFADDFRGQDLYQRFGGLGTGYGNAPVALHMYEIELP